VGGILTQSAFAPAVQMRREVATAFVSRSGSRSRDL
jgi:hypothetical protein